MNDNDDIDLYILGSFATSGSAYETSTWPTLVYDITCIGDETTLLDCSYSLSSTAQTCGRDAAVVCQGNNVNTICV